MAFGSSVPREAEGASQERTRIAGAIVELVGSRGFRQTRLADVLALARVSEEEFHRHFADTEDCFVKVWQELTAEHAELMAAAYERNADWLCRMRAMAELTLEFLQADRNRARFLVLEVLNAGEIAQALRDLAIAGQAALIDEGRRLLDDPDALSPAVAGHVAGAINEMLIRSTESGELFKGDRAVRELMYLAVRPYLGHQAALAELHRSRGSGESGVEHRAGEFAAQEFPERARLRHAVMESVVEKGLTGADLAAILRQAGFSRAAFERDFADLEECCARIYRANVREFDRVVFGAADRRWSWRDRVRATAYAAARFVRDRPLETRFDMIQMLEAGDEVQAFRDRYVARIIDLIDEGRDETEDPGSVTRATAVGVFGSIYELLQKDLQQGRGTGTAELLVPQLMYLVVRPYLGHSAAAEELTLAAPPEREEALR